MNMLTELPPNTFQLASAEVEPFVDNLSENFLLSRPANVICKQLLEYGFRKYGGYDEPASEPDGHTLAYHNGSHWGYVMATTLWLAARRGAKQLERDAAAVAGCGHDLRHGSPTPGQDEHESVRMLCDWLRPTPPLQKLTSIIPAPLLGTIVERIDPTGIYQRAITSKNQLTQDLADGDLSALAVPNAGGWAIRLYKEEQEGKGYSRQAAKRFLEHTVNIQRHHAYISPLGQQTLRLMARAEADNLQPRIPDLISEFAA